MQAITKNSTSIVRFPDLRSPLSRGQAEERCAVAGQTCFVLLSARMSLFMRLRKGSPFVEIKKMPGKHVPIAVQAFGGEVKV